ncbi:membrane protein insertion efficiency factor YidD [Runella sp.]|uniref:membrane protein insertion efficiency factor YidD n=1 Tax=Runella sp. TaxID=1960881 RepID=UPI003D0F3DBD
MIDPKNIKIGNDTFEFNVDPKDAVLIERHFAKLTKRDKEIESLTIPDKPIWLNLIIRSIRFYQGNLSHRLGNRCVFDPSCSHYAELAFREKGFLKGVKLTIARLKRCRPENGGIDELTKPTN